MSFFEAILFGFIQGLAEFLPISSSGHLAIIENLANVHVDLTFDIMLHFGTLIAIFVAFWKDITAIVVEFFKWMWLLIHRKRSLREPAARRMIKLLLIASLPLPALVFVEKYAGSLKNYPIIIGFALLVTGLLLWAADKVGHGKKNEMSAHFSDAFLVGIAQCIAAIPGLSRSGTTISTGLMRRFNRPFAVRFSFLMAIPTILGATVYELIKALKGGGEETGLPMSEIWPQTLVGMVVAGVVGYFAIALVKKLIKSDKFGYFAYYCWIVGALVIVGAITGVLKTMTNA